MMLPSHKLNLIYFSSEFYQKFFFHFFPQSRKKLLRYSNRFFTLLLSTVVAIFMIENQEKTLYLMLWFSTVYLTLKATCSRHQPNPRAAN